MKQLETPTTSQECAAALLDAVPQVMRLVRAAIRTSRGGELSVPQFRALRYLGANPGASLLAVAQHLGLTPPSMSKLVDGLIARKLVRREASTVDRRRVTMSLTAPGKTTLERARRQARARLAEQLATLSAEEQATLMQATVILQRVFAVESESGGQ